MEWYLYVCRFCVFGGKSCKNNRNDWVELLHRDGQDIRIKHRHIHVSFENGVPYSDGVC